MKQTFNIHAGCKIVSVEQVGNQIITSFEPEKYVPKVGDLVRRISGCGSHYIGEYNGDKELYNCIDLEENKIKEKMYMIVDQGSFHQLTPEEFQAEFEKLGYVYDFETHTAHKKRWRAKLKRDYYYVGSTFDIEVDREDAHSVDAKRHKSGNYFETKEECQKYCDYLKECSLKYFEK